MNPLAEVDLKLSERKFVKGEIPLAFDVLLGDALFVDRMSYNFITPKAGDPIVFRTASIDRFNYELEPKPFLRLEKINITLNDLLASLGINWKCAYLNLFSPMEPM